MAWDPIETTNDAVNTATGAVSKTTDRWGKGIGKAFGYDTSDQKEARAESERLGQAETDQTRERVQWMEENDRKYKDQLSGYGNEYLRDLDRVRGDMNSQVNDARKTYSNDIQPRMKGIMEKAQQQAGQAMSLEDAGNVNNSVHRGVRDLYDQQAQGVQNQSVADYGVLSALGAQATQNTMGAAGPMTGAQTQLLSAGNQSQAGVAYQKAQQRVQSLREQGIDRGFQESDRQYQRGVDATERYGRTVGDYEGAMDRNNQREQGYRDQDMNFASDRFGSQRGMAQEQLGIEQGIRNRDLGAINQDYARKQGAVANDIAAADAQNAAKRGILGGVLQGGATAAGAYYGGAEGAKAGASAGGGIAGGMQAGAGSGYQAPPRAQQQPQRYSYA